MNERGLMETQALDLVRVKISGDGLRASACMGAGVEESADSCAIRQAIERAGIRFGLLEHQIKTLAMSPGEEIVIAEGKPAVSGKSGWVERLVAIPKPEGECAGGMSTLHKFLLVWNVHQGGNVARVYEPEPGIEGMNVRGLPIIPRQGKKVHVRLGKGVYWSGDTPGLVLASCDGNAIVESDGLIDVQEVIELPDGLDYTVGNIDFVGSVDIRGDVASDLQIKVGKNCRVHGDVADTFVEAGGDVIVDRGFLGRGIGRICAGGSVTVQHILNQSITAANSVQILRESVNGTVSAGKSILAPNAVVTGGFLEADELIEVGSLGISEGSQAKVRVGRRGKIIERLNILDKEVHQSEKTLAELKDAVYKLVRMKIDVGQLTPERELLLERLQEAQRQLPAKLSAQKAEQERLNGALRAVSEARLIVRGTIHANVFLDINGARKINDTALTGAMFVERNGAIEASGV